MEHGQYQSSQSDAPREPVEVAEALRKLSMSPSVPASGRRGRRIVIGALLLLILTISFAWWLLTKRPPGLLYVSWPDFIDPAETWRYGVNSPRFLVIVRPGARVHVRADAVSGSFRCAGRGTVRDIQAVFEGPGEGECLLVKFAGVDDRDRRVACRLGILSVRIGGAADILGPERAGAYPDPARSGVKKIRDNAHRYVPPEYWVTTAGYEEWPVSAHCLLGDFLGDRLGRRDEPPAIALDYRLVWKLEEIARALRREGIAPAGIHVISGFREPAYNRSARIGGSKFSRHQYGDAADFVVDHDGDGKWDDIDGDGDVDLADVKTVARFIEDMEMDGIIGPGGIGAYRVSDDGVRGSVHIDCRGVAARWGSTWRRGKKVNIEWWSEKYRSPGQLEESEEDGESTEKSTETSEEKAGENDEGTTGPKDEGKNKEKDDE